MANPLTEDPGQSPLDSPWLQLGVPLATTIASAIWPRHAGRAAAATLGGLSTVNEARQGQWRMKQAFQKEQDDTAYSKNWDTTIDGMQDKPASASAPEGGTAPEAQANAQTASLEHGVVPTPTGSGFHVDPGMVPALKQLGHDPRSRATAGNILEKMYTQYQKEHAGVAPGGLNTYLHNLNLPPDASVNDIEIQGGGHASYSPKQRYATPGDIPSLAPGQKGSFPLATGGEISADNPLPNYDHVTADSGQMLGFDPRTNTMAPTRVTARLGGVPAPAQSNIAPAAAPAPAGPAPAPPGPAPAPTSQGGRMTAPGGQAPAPAGAGGLTFGGAGKPEEASLRGAMASWNATHADASPVERQQAAVFLKKGINTDDLDRLSDMLVAKKPGAMVDIQKAIGRGTDVRAYIYGRAARVAAQNGVPFDPVGVDNTINAIREFSDQKTGPGRSLVAVNTSLVHSARAAVAVQKLADTGVPVLNMGVRDFLKDYAGSEAQVEVNTALSVVPYEYMTFIKKGNALDKNDIEKANQMFNPESMTVGQLLTALKGTSHILVDQAGQMNFGFKRTTGENIPDMYSPQAAQAAKVLQLPLDGTSGAAGNDKPTVVGVGIDHNGKYGPKEGKVLKMSDGTIVPSK